MFFDWLFGEAPQKVNPSEQEKTLAAEGVKGWNRFVSNYLPVEDRMLDKFRDTKNAANMLAGKANLETAKTTSGAGLDSAILNRSLQSGVGRNSGSNITAIAALSQANTRARAAGKVAGATAAEDRKLRGLIKTFAGSQGLEDATSVSLGSAAERATRSALNAEDLRLANTRMWQDAVGQAAGTYAGYKYAKRRSQKEEE